MANTVKTTFTGDTRPMDKAVREHHRSIERVAKDVERYQRERARNEEKLTAHMARQADIRSRDELRSIQRTQREIERIRRDEERSALQSSQRIANVRQNIAGTVVGGVAGAGYLAKQAVQNTLEQVRATRLLSSAATEAGLAQGVLAQKNRDFAASVGLSVKGAAETTANITRLAVNTGNTGQLDRLLKSFADLGAARGIQGPELNNLIGTILSGQDEGLNRLGIADPGQLYKSYADQLGKTVEQLSQAEKVQAAVNAVLDKSAIFAGAAEARMGSLEGQVAKNAAAWENFTDALSNTFTTSGPVTDFLSEASRLLQGLQSDLEGVNKELAKGKSPEQIAREQYPEASWSDRITAALSGGGLFALAGMRNPAGILLPTWARNAADPNEVYGRRFNARVDQIRNQQISNTSQEAAANQQRQNLAQTPQQVISNEKSLIALDKERAEQRQRDQEKFNQSVEAGRRKALEFGSAARTAFTSITQQQGQRNPFLAFLNDAEAKMESLRINTRGLSGDLRTTFGQLQQKENALGLFDLQATTRLDALGLRDQAAEFRQGYRNDLSDPATAQRLLDAQLRAAGGRKRFGGGAFFDINPSTGALTRVPTDGFESSRNSIIDQKIIGLSQSLDPANLRDDQRSQIAGAFEREASRRLDSELEAKLQRGKMVGHLEKLSNDVSTLLGVANTGGLDAVVRFVNESDRVRVTKQPKQAATNNLYGTQ